MAERLYLRKVWLNQAEELYKNQKEESYYFAGNVHEKNLDDSLNILKNQDTRQDFYAYDLKTGDAKIVGNKDKLSIKVMSVAVENNGKTNPDYKAILIKIIN